MNNGKYYVVKVQVSYVKMEFVFSTMVGACNFMELFLDHISRDMDEADVHMERVDYVTSEEESEDE